MSASAVVHNLLFVPLSAIRDDFTPEMALALDALALELAIGGCIGGGLFGTKLLTWKGERDAEDSHNSG